MHRTVSQVLRQSCDSGLHSSEILRSGCSSGGRRTEGNDLTPPAPHRKKNFRRSRLRAIPTHQALNPMPNHKTQEPASSSEKVSSTPGAPAETSDSSSDAYEDHSAPKAEAPVSVPSRDHESCSSDTVVLAAPRRRELRWTRHSSNGTCRSPDHLPIKTTTMIMPPTATSTRGSKYSAQTPS
ncbi:hypothetical protein HPB52_007851 [Rhipicephalus sanguineus]|uniref:Uncharacterized protein n=1 Tax=Rhipicephalus sanguineus TaxID=34632 RepID=A0A9D4SQH2_RHISA|nr:hypothetical protein HPB52_007851 [Rhipicephalus sanguineus]